MEWLQILSLFLANAGLVLWMRAESRNDWKHMDQKLDAWKEESQREMKDFHSRLVVLEERYFNWLMREK